MPEPKFTREEVAAQVAMIYRQAADLIDVGWCQGRFHEIHKSGRDRFCLYGAVNQASIWHGSLASNTAWDSLPKHMRRTLGVWPAAFNDHPGRTASEVSSLLRDMANAANADWRDLEVPCA